MASILCCTSGNQTVEAVVQPAWDNHFAAFGGQDVSKVLLDYCEESKIIVYNWHDDTETVYNGMAGACVEIKILRRVRAESSRRPPRHRRDACSMAWRCRFLAARPSRTPDALVDFHTGLDVDAGVFARLGLAEC